MQFGGSLIAILVLAWLVKRMGLGPLPLLETEAEVIAAAREVSDSFDAVDLGRDRAGRAALLRDDRGQIMLLRQHGVHFAGRILGPEASARQDGQLLHIDSGERRFGSIAIAVDEPSAWAERINTIRSA